MSVWEAKVTVRVEKTVRLETPYEDDPKNVAKSIANLFRDPTGLWKTLQHYSPEFGTPRPVERIVDNDLLICDVKKV